MLAARVAAKFLGDSNACHNVKIYRQLHCVFLATPLRFTATASVFDSRQQSQRCRKLSVTAV